MIAVFVLSTLVIIAIFLCECLVDSTMPHIDISKMRYVCQIGAIVISLSWIIYSIIMYSQKGFSSTICIGIGIAIIILMLFTIMKYKEHTKKIAKNIVEVWNEETGKYEIIGRYKMNHLKIKKIK